MKIKWLLGCASSVAALVPGLAVAQADGQDADAPNEIIVTAQKRAQNIQDVPITMQAVGGEQLAQRGIQSAYDIPKIAPNITVSTQGAANRQIAIRGVGTNDFFGNATGSVGVYMDEVTMSAPYLTNLGLYDLDRVEVLRGPQNTLFGRNTTGGAVNYISKQPELGGDVDGFVRLNYGNFNRIDAETGFNVPLGDVAALRLAGMFQHSDGMWHNLADGGARYGKKNRFSLRGTLLLEPSDNTKITLNAHYGQEDSQIDPFRFVGLRAPSGSIFAPGLSARQLDFEGISGGANSQGRVVDTSRWSDIYRVGDDQQYVEAYGFYAKLVQDLGDVSLTSITSYDKSDVRFTYDLGGPGATDNDITMINGNDQSFKQMSQELRLQSTGKGPLRWIAGFYYFHESSLLGQNMGFGPFNGGTGAGGAAALLLLAGDPYSNQAAFSIARLKNEVLSPYGQVEYDIGQKVTVSFGLRYTDDKKRAPSLFVGNVGTGTLGRDQFRSNEVIGSLASGLPLCDLDGDGNLAGGTPDNRGKPCSQILSPDDIRAKEWGGKVGIDFKLADDTLLYASASRGFRSGKHDIEFFHGPQTGFAREDQQVETLDAFEVGLKSELFDRTLVLNAAVFYYIWKDQQFFDVNPNTGPVFINVPESQLKGAEIELRWNPGSGFSAQLSGGYLDSEVTDAGNDPSGLVQKGHALPFAPKYSANALVAKEFEIGDNKLRLQADLQYLSKSKGFLRDVNYVDAIGSSIFLNTRATWSFGADHRYDLSVYATNLTGQTRCEYKRDLFAFSGAAYCLPNSGRTLFGAEARVKF
ncbi:TonB-dependent receptor [Sphingopyxis sp. DBS4]|uniref:TonB-dependent receptor n=1 Tax=Sphingopyxis sp. DBS4 TaxID=2968500 RepID=UPI00214C19B6|nr:TonB-dependent receptor [Sphingopyxis sp. DBS4]